MILEHNYPISFCKDVANISTKYELTNSELKRKYIIFNINLINTIMQSVDGYKGSFGTGYPFYAFGKKLDGEIPIIEEQLRYNNALIESVDTCNNKTWVCGNCLSQFCDSMPDLKIFCKPCPKMSNELKPRKIINRLPDIDIWMIAEDAKINTIKNTLSKLFEYYDLHTSDVDPLQTIDDVKEIVETLAAGNMPMKKLPIDIHIIGYNELSELIKQLPIILMNAKTAGEKPYLPIHPISLRKKWQYDDESYNFVLDFLFSLTDYNWDNDLKELLNNTRNTIVKNFNVDELYDILIETSPVVSRRIKNPVLTKTFKMEVSSWKEL